MKIAILTPGILPVPATKGGAVETLIEFYIQDNEENRKHTLFVFSISEENAKRKSTNYPHCNFFFLKQDSFFNKVRRYYFRKKATDIYYNYYMDFYACQALKQIQKIKIDALLIENRPNFVLLASKFLSDTPIILHLHNDTLDNNTPHAREILQKCTKVITVSQYIQKKVESIPTSQNKVTTVYNGIDLTCFSSPLKSLSRSSFGIKEDDFLVIYTGRISPIKGIRELVKAYSLLDNYPNIKLLIVGNSDFGNAHEDRFTKEVKKMASTLKEKILFTGFIPYKDIPAVLSLADIGVIPSICEDALTLSSIECMAMGLPLIITRSGGIPEAVNENCALIVDKQDLSHLPQLLADAILTLYGNPLKRKEMSRFARQKASEFSKEKYAFNLYTEINDVTSI